jgi:hypothetical protein
MQSLKRHTAKMILKQLELNHKMWVLDFEYIHYNPCDGLNRLVASQAQPGTQVVNEKTTLIKILNLP